MNYHPDDFLALCDTALDEDCRLLEEPCEGTIVKLKQPDSSGEMVWKRFHTCHCNQVARIDVSYDRYEPIHLEADEPGVVIADSHPARPATNAGQPEPQYFARVCAVDDAVGLWPRFSHIISDKSYLR